MVESQTFFTKMVDELVEFSEHDPELSDGLKWLDGEAQKKGLSFYDMVYQVLYKHDVNSKAKEWLNRQVDEKLLAVLSLNEFVKFTNKDELNAF